MVASAGAAGRARCKFPFRGAGITRNNHAEAYPMELLKDRVAIITGGTGALGRAVNEHFLSHGAKVAVPYIIDAEVPLFHEKMGGRFPAANIHLAKIDVGNEDQVGAFVGEVEKKFGRVD